MTMVSNLKRAVLFWICSVIYLAGTQFIRAIWEVKLYMESGISPGNSIGTGFLIAAVLFLPGIIYLAVMIKQSSIKVIFEYMMFSFRKNKWKYIFYILIVCFLCINFGEGYLYMSNTITGGAIKLNPAETSYIMMSMCHYLFADIASIVYLVLLPFVCSVFAKKTMSKGSAI